MNQEKFTHALTELFQEAYSLATTQFHSTLQPLHLLATIIDHDVARSCFQSLNVDTKALSGLIQQEIAKLPQVKGGTVSADQSLQTFFNECDKESKSFGDEFLSVDICLLALSGTKTLPASIVEFFKKYCPNQKVR
jgi:ATP-dependent Clp protease ATP-binding subunit ClpB